MQRKKKQNHRTGRAQQLPIDMVFIIYFRQNGHRDIGVTPPKTIVQTNWPSCGEPARQNGCRDIGVTPPKTIVQTNWPSCGEPARHGAEPSIRISGVPLIYSFPT
jgi:hypothetical protein